MSAVVKKSLLCCLNKKRLYLGAVKLPLSPGLRQWLLGPWPPPAGALPPGANLCLGELREATGHGALLGRNAGWRPGGCSLLWLHSACAEGTRCTQLGAGAWPGLVGWRGLWLEGPTGKGRDP